MDVSDQVFSNQFACHNSELKNLQAVFYVHFVSKMLSSCRFENGFCVQALFRTEAIIRVVMNFKCYVIFIFHLKMFSVISTTILCS